METSDLGRLLVIMGIALALVGAFLIAGGRVPFLGQLPGDLSFERDGVTVYFPLGTMVVASLVLTLVLNLVGRFFR